MIAVTGANGLLGSFIVRRLIDEGEPFVALKRTGSDISLLHDVREKITWRDADVRDAFALEEAFAGIDTVIHAAAMVSFNPRLTDQLFQVNVTGTRNIVNACIATGVKKLVHISSVAALGRTREQPFIDEHQKWLDNPLNSTYAQSKYLAELEVFRGLEEGLDCVLLNPSIVLAPADWTKSSAKLFKYVWDENKFLINNHLNYVDVRDVAYAAHRLMNHNATGHRFILNAGNISLDQFFIKIAARFGKKAPNIRVNGSILRVMAAAEGIRSRITRSEPLITSETVRLANTNFLYRNEKIKKHLQFHFQTIDQTLDWCCKYYLERTSEAQKMK